MAIKHLKQINNMKKLVFMLGIISIISCNRGKNTLQDAMKESMEEAIENKTGSHVDLADSEDFDTNAGFVAYKSAAKTYLNGEEKMTAAVLFQKENDGLAISFQLTGNEGQSFITILNHIPDNFSLPLEGRFAVSNAYDGENPVATAVFMEVNENGLMASEVPYEGIMRITKLTKDSMEFEIDGRGGDATDANSPSNWKSITGNGKITSPIIQSFGIDKNDVLK